MKIVVKFVQISEMQGITLLELLLVMAILTIMGVAGFGIYYGYSLGVDIEEEQNRIAEKFREAKGNAVSVEQGYAWGVRVDNLASSTVPFYAIFAGDSYRRSATTSTTTMTSALEFQDPKSGNFIELVFTKRSGTTTAATTTFIRSKNDTSVRKSVTVSAKGLISK